MDNVVGIRTDNQKIFQSQSYENDEEKANISALITEDATNSGIEIEIQYMTTEELFSYIDSH